MNAQDAHQDDVAVDVFTSAGLFRGMMRLPRATTLLEHFNRAGEHLRLADVHVEGDPTPVPFLAIRRDSVRLVVPRDARGVEAAAPKGPDQTTHDVAGVMESYRFRGRVRLAPGQRMTDFLAAAPAFVVLRDAQTWRAGQAEARPTASDVALVRAHSIVAFSDTID